jgi:hypothetical protein
MSVGTDRISVKLGGLLSAGTNGREYGMKVLLHAPSIDFDNYIVEDNLQSTAALLYSLLQYKTNTTAYTRPAQVIRSITDMPRSGATLDSVKNGRVVYPSEESDILLWILCGAAMLAIWAGLADLYRRSR